MHTIRIRRMRVGRLLILGTAIGLLLVMSEGSASAEEIPKASPAGAGLQAASWLATIPYGAVKAAYAIGGGIVGGLAWVMTGGDTAVATSVWIPSMTGDYIVQPQHLVGQKPLHFVGVPSDEPPA